MERIASDLKASEMKQQNLAKAYEALHSQASSLLVLSVQWKDLQEHFDSTRDASRTCFEELQEREKHLEAKESKIKAEMESKQDELFGVQELVDEKVQEAIELKRSIQKHREEIEGEEKRMLEVQKLVVDKERECGLIERRIQEHTKKLNWVERRIEEKSNEVESKGKELNKYHEDIKVKLEQVSVIDGAIKERQEKIESKEEEIKGAQMLMGELERRVKSKVEKLSWIEKSIEDSSKLANSKEQEVRVIQGSLNVYRESIKSKESELDVIFESIEGKKKDIDVKEEQIKTLQRLIEGSEKELKLKEEKLREEKLQQECKKHLEEKERQLEVKSVTMEQMHQQREKHLETKERQLEVKSETMEKFQQECKRRLEEKERQLEVKSVTMEQMHQEREKYLETKERPLEVKSETMEKLQQECKRRLEETERQLEVKSVIMEQLHQEREKHLDTKERQLEVKSETMEKLQQECKKHLEEKEAQLEVKSVTMEQMHQQREKQLEAKERQLEEQGKELELTKKQFGSQMKVNSELLESTPAANNSASDHSKINIRDARGLQLFMYEHLKRNESVTKEISALLQQESLEPAKLVLEAIQGFHPSNSILGNDEFDLGLIRRSCILLLQELKRITVQISPQVREEAMKLASDWKAKMTVGTESEWEILGFLQLVSTYQLTSVYDANELRGLLEKVDQQEQATELSRAFGTTDKAPANNSSVASVPTEKAVSPAEANFSSPNHQPTAKNSIIVAPGTIGKRNRQRASFVPRNAAAIVPPNVVGAIQSFIQQKKLVNAYELIRKFNLFHKFPPQQVLKEYVEKAMKCMEIRKARKNLYEQDQVVNKGIADLRRAIDCIKAHNLESHYTSESIEKQIQELKKFMEDRRNENQKKRLCSTVNSSFQQHEHKFQRTSLSAERSSGLHPDYPNPGSFYNGQFSIPSNNYPVQFSMPANRPLGYGKPWVCPSKP